MSIKKNEDRFGKLLIWIYLLYNDSFCNEYG